MKVLFVLGHATGGLGGHVDRLATGLREQGERVEIVTAADTAEQFGWSDARRLWPVHRGVAAPRGLVDWHRIMLAAGRNDVVHAHGMQAAVVAAVAVFRASPRPRFVVSLHNDLPPGGRAAALATPVLRWALRQADLVTGASEDLTELARGLGARRTETVPVASGLVANLLTRPAGASRADLRSRLVAGIGPGVDPDRPLVLSAGRIAPQKDLGTAIAAARRSRQPATWVHLGDGDPRLRADLQAQAAGSGMHLLAATPDLAQWLAAADIFLVTSRWEARALVVQEAMAAGLPVVATAVGGLPGLLGETGVLVPVGDAAAVAAAVDGLLADPGRRAELGAAARELARTWATPAEETRDWRSRYAATPGT